VKTREEEEGTRRKMPDPARGGGSKALSFGAYAEPRRERQQRRGHAFRVALVAADCLLLGLQPVLVHLSKGADGKYAYNPLAVNLLVEIAKVLFALSVLVAVGSGRPGPPLFRSARAFAADARHNWLLAVPAFLYAVNNYLKFAMQLHFRPTTTKMLGNLKVFVIALMMRSVLGRRFSVLQWEALFLLVAGVTANQLAAGGGGGGGGGGLGVLASGPCPDAGAAVAAAAASLASGPPGSEAARAAEAAKVLLTETAARLVAAAPAAAAAATTAAAAAATASSSFLPAALCVLGTVTVPSAASVYNELALKRHMDTSVHLQNFFLYFFGALFNLAGVLALCVWRGESPLRVMTAHQSGTTLLLVAVNAAQGVLASFFYKWADTILKKYSSTIATVATALLSWALFSHELTPGFLLGVSIVCVSMHQFFSVAAVSLKKKRAGGAGGAGGGPPSGAGEGGGAAADRKASAELGGGGANSSGMIVSPSMDHLSMTSAAVSAAVNGGIDPGHAARQPLLPR